MEFPTGNAQRPGRQGRVAKGRPILGRSEQAAAERRSTRRPRARLQQRAVRFRRELRIANTRRERAATLVQLLSIWAPKPDVVLKHWVDDPKSKMRTGDCRESASRDVPQRRRHALHGRVAPVSLSHCRDAADRGARDSRRRADAAEHAELQRPAVQVREAAARARRCPQGAAVEASLALRRRVPGHRSRSRQRSCSCWRQRNRRQRSVRCQPDGACAPRLALRRPSPWRALRRRRSQAVDLSLPPRRHRDLQPRARADRGVGQRRRHSADDELPLHRRALRLGQQRVQVAVPISGDAAFAAVCAAGTRARRARGHRPA